MLYRAKSAPKPTKKGVSICAAGFSRFSAGMRNELNVSPSWLGSFVRESRTFSKKWREDCIVAL